MGQAIVSTDFSPDAGPLLVSDKYLSLRNDDRDRSVTFMLGVIRRPSKVASKIPDEVCPPHMVLSKPGILKDSCDEKLTNQPVEQELRKKRKKKFVTFKIDEIQRSSKVAPGTPNEVCLLPVVLSTPDILKDAPNVPVEASTELMASRFHKASPIKDGVEYPELDEEELCDMPPQQTADDRGCHLKSKTAWAEELDANAQDSELTEDCQGYILERKANWRQGLNVYIKNSPGTSGNSEA
ncbi:uncharacterized protein LOC122113639 [Dipodomys spectabilis]|uniref:uncharacterized protein LOC122113639 n=1 Tax=Dipodomys spectabilis TaxID=105255 RepID=UPI001C5461F3|nr:uncharacterized protein LOC122113639 [Dipodomys spectabilis]